MPDRVDVRGVLAAGKVLGTQVINVQVDEPPDGGGDAGPDDLHDGLGGHAPHGRPLDVIDGSLVEVLTKNGDVDENIVDVMTKDMRMVGRRTLCLKDREIPSSDSQIIVNDSGSNSFSAADQMEKKTGQAAKPLESVDDAKA